MWVAYRVSKDVCAVCDPSQAGLKLPSRMWTRTLTEHTSTA
jgi:hypothetical protein